MTGDSHVRYALDGDVAIIRLADPATLNAMTVETASALHRALDRAADAARVILLTGEGRGFCSGARLSADVDPHADSYDAGSVLDRYLNPLMLRVRDLPIPIVTAVNGPAAGAGAALALAGDIILAARSAYFLQAFRHIGLVPDGGAAVLLVQAAGRPRAMEMMLLGEKLPAEKALAWGLVNRVCDDDALFGDALAIARNLSAGPTIALGMTRKLCWDAAEGRFSESLATERQLQRIAGRTADHREGIAAFLAKRPPAYSGR